MTWLRCAFILKRRAYNVCPHSEGRSSTMTDQGSGGKSWMLTSLISEKVWGPDSARSCNVDHSVLLELRARLIVLKIWLRCLYQLLACKAKWRKVGCRYMLLCLSTRVVSWFFRVVALDCHPQANLLGRKRRRRAQLLRLPSYLPRKDYEVRSSVFLPFH